MDNFTQLLRTDHPSSLQDSTAGSSVSKFTTMELFPEDLNTAMTFTGELSTTMTFPRKLSTTVTFPGELSTALTFPGELSTAMTFPGELSTAMTLPGELSTTMTFPGELSTAMTFSGELSTVMTFPGELSTAMIYPGELSAAMTFPNDIVMTVRSVRLYWLIVIVPLGLLGNVLSFTVAVQKHNRHISCFVYMAALAVTDSCFLLTACFRLCLMMGVIQAIDTARSLCKVLAFLSFSLSQSGVGIILALTVDRTITVARPLKAKTLCSAKRATRTVLAIAVAMLLYNGPRIIVTDVIFIMETTCISFDESLLSRVYMYMNFVVNAIVPFFGILAMNAKIWFILMPHTSPVHQPVNQSSSSTINQKVPVATVSQQPSESTINQQPSESIVSQQPSKSTISQQPSVNIVSQQSPESTVSQMSSERTVTRQPYGGTVSQQPSKKLSKTQVQLSVMMVVVSLAFLMFTMPKFGHLIVYAYKDDAWKQDPSSVAWFTLSGIITHGLYLTNSAVNFYLYSVSGSKFRAELVKLFTCAK